MTGGTTGPWTKEDEIDIVAFVMFAGAKRVQ